MTDGTSAQTLIDVHAHFLAPVHERTLAERARSDKTFTDPIPTWTPELAIEFMDTHGIAAQLLSYPRPLTPDDARESNDFAAAVVANYPDRFGMLANLPLGDPKAAVTEIARASDDLGTDGFIVVTNYDGAYLGNPKFDPVFAELDRRGATVFVHPVQPPGFDLVSCGRPAAVIEFPFDTTRSVLDAIYARVFIRYPKVNLIVAHAGGVLPSLTSRISAIGTRSWVPHDEEVTSRSVEAQVAGLYYDTAIAGTTCSLGPLMEVTTADHLVFGSDFPPAGVDIIEDMIAALRSSSSVSAQELADTTDTALRLFPSLANRRRVGR